MSDLIPLVTVDGPSGSGKGTVCRLIAEALGWNLLDSGMLYRVLAYYALTESIDLQAEEQLAGSVAHLNLTFKANEDKSLCIHLNDVDVTVALREEKTGNAASIIAALPKVRQALYWWQRNFWKSPGLIADGRDMGTVVFPEADLKFYLEASIEERAKRRYLQLQGLGKDVSLGDLLLEVAKRDERDKTRECAPLKPAEDALIIDSTNMSVTEVTEQIVALIRKRFL